MTERLRQLIKTKGWASMTNDELVELLRAYYQMEGHCTGGPLHIAVEDGNLDDPQIRWCLDTGFDMFPCEGHDCRAETIRIAEALLALPEDERYRFWENRYGDYYDDPRRAGR